MAVTALVPTPFGYAPGVVGVDLTPTDWTSISAATGVSAPNDGRTLIVINNGTASPLSVTPKITHTVQNQPVSNLASAIPAGKVQGFGPFPVADFGKTIELDFTAPGAGATAAAFEMTSA